jgi:hypothetical protein
MTNTQLMTNLHKQILKLSMLLLLLGALGIAIMIASYYYFN